jgi:hypothetical protein
MSTWSKPGSSGKAGLNPESDVTELVVDILPWPRITNYFFVAHVGGCAEVERPPVSIVPVPDQPPQPLAATCCRRGFQCSGMKESVEQLLIAIRESAQNKLEQEAWTRARTRWVRTELAAARLVQALAEYRRLGDKRGEAFALNGFGLIALEAGERRSRCGIATFRTKRGSCRRGCVRWAPAGSTRRPVAQAGSTSW